ncbi:unnamed protein product [Strongylus vulgaris]|uniref:Mos1 transposase HTH domain-containing protein n=1 Tax=Strongylus vulgaris TaxID=40348 RepID=A0A3P7LKF1_STRVU|nr:unnamed protein product [Strongylus vulgaris]
MEHLDGFFAFLRGQNAAGAAREICIAYGEDAIAEFTTRKWFAKFQNGDFDLTRSADFWRNAMPNWSRGGKR